MDFFWDFKVTEVLYDRSEPMVASRTKSTIVMLSIQHVKLVARKESCDSEHADIVRTRTITPQENPKNQLLQCHRPLAEQRQAEQLDCSHRPSPKTVVTSTSTFFRFTPLFWQ
jgi:hypothetical protein